MEIGKNRYSQLSCSSIFAINRLTVIDYRFFIDWGTAGARVPRVPEVFSRAQRTEILRFDSAALRVSTIQTCPIPETAHEKPLAPRVVHLEHSTTKTNVRHIMIIIYEVPTENKMADFVVVTFTTEVSG